MINVLEINKIFCITNFSNERLSNILEQKNKLNLDIEFIYPEYDEFSARSLKKTFLKIIQDNKNKYNKILILEDDFWTDLNNNEIISYVNNSGYNEINFDVFTLGSPIFEIENQYKNILKINSFGYAHSLIINLEKISNDFINELSNLDEPLDSTLSRMSNNKFDVYGFNQGIFQQKNNFKSNISPEKPLENFNHSFRYLRDKTINTGIITKVEDQNTYLENKTNAWSYYTNGIVRKRIDFNSTYDNFFIKIYDYYSGAYTHTFNINYENFFIEFDILTPKVVLEIKDINNKILYNELITRN